MRRLQRQPLRPRQTRRQNGVTRASGRRPSGKRSLSAEKSARLPFSPPEDWHEPGDCGSGYRIIVQPPGAGYRHVLTPSEIRARLSELPPRFLEELEVVQLSRMTLKKQSFPCYGMQWGTALYLYPIETSFVESFSDPPRPALFNETKMYGGRWYHDAPTEWRLVWTESTIKDYYLNNILIHELGHLLDERNSSYVDRERYAEWFAIHYGYLPTQARRKQSKRHEIRRRHHRSLHA